MREGTTMTELYEKIAQMILDRAPLEDLRAVCAEVRAREEKT